MRYFLTPRPASTAGQRLTFYRASAAHTHRVSLVGGARHSSAGLKSINTSTQLQLTVGQLAGLLPFLGSPRPIAFRDFLRFLEALLTPLKLTGAPGSEKELALVGLLALN